MKPVDQTIFGADRGNCMPACLARWDRSGAGGVDMQVKENIMILPEVLRWWKAITLGADFHTAQVTLSGLDRVLGTELLPAALLRCPEAVEFEIGSRLMSRHWDEIMRIGLPHIPRSLRVCDWARGPMRACFVLWYGVAQMRGTCPIPSVEWDIGLIRRASELRHRPGLWGWDLYREVRSWCGSEPPP
jgi:hypothetical protein